MKYEIRANTQSPVASRNGRDRTGVLRLHIFCHRHRQHSEWRARHRHVHPTHDMTTIKDNSNYHNVNVNHRSIQCYYMTILCYNLFPKITFNRKPRVDLSTFISCKKYSKLYNSNTAVGVPKPRSRRLSTATGHNYHYNL